MVLDTGHDGVGVIHSMMPSTCTQQCEDTCCCETSMTFDKMVQ